MTPNTQWLVSLRDALKGNSKLMDIASDLRIGEKGPGRGLGKAMLGTFAAGFLLKKLINSADFDEEDMDLTRLYDRLYYN